MLGPLFGHMFLMLVDLHSKWMDVNVVMSAMSSTMIEHLRNIIATHGLPKLE